MGACQAPGEQHPSPASLPSAGGSPPGEQGLVLPARGSFVPVLPALGRPVSAFAGRRPGPDDKGMRSLNGCCTAGMFPGILVPLRSCSRHCCVPPWSRESAGGADGRERWQPACSSAGTSHHGPHAFRGGACRVSFCLQWHGAPLPACVGSGTAMGCGSRSWGSVACPAAERGSLPFSSLSSASRSECPAPWEKLCKLAGQQIPGERMPGVGKP